MVSDYVLYFKDFPFSTKLFLTKYYIVDGWLVWYCSNLIALKSNIFLAMLLRSGVFCLCLILSAATTFGNPIFNKRLVPNREERFQIKNAGMSLHTSSLLVKHVESLVFWRAYFFALIPFPFSSPGLLRLPLLPSSSPLLFLSVRTSIHLSVHPSLIPSFPFIVPSFLPSFLFLISSFPSLFLSFFLSYFLLFFLSLFLSFFLSFLLSSFLPFFIFFSFLSFILFFSPSFLLFFSSSFFLFPSFLSFIIHASAYTWTPSFTSLSELVYIYLSHPFHFAQSFTILAQ